MSNTNLRTSSLCSKKENESVVSRPLNYTFKSCINSIPQNGQMYLLLFLYPHAKLYVLKTNIHQIPVGIGYHTVIIFGDS